MAPVYEEELFVLISALASSVPSMLLGIASYVLTALAIYTISRRRGLRKPWLAWIPVVNCWLIGSLSDQYRYVVKGEEKSKRKWLLLLNILTFALSVVILILAFAIIGVAIFGSYRLEEQLLSRIMGPAMGMVGLCLPLVGVAIAYAVIYYMAMYDIYRSLDPDNSVLFLVLSILFSITEPFFLFFNRNKDKGMPPRKQPQSTYIPPQEPQRQPQEPVQEPWEADNKDYL